jgi:hypothetical protein
MAGKAPVSEGQNLPAGRVGSNDPSSATRPTRRVDCNHGAMAGFVAALLGGSFGMQSFLVSVSPYAPKPG